MTRFLQAAALVALSALALPALSVDTPDPKRGRSQCRPGASGGLDSSCQLRKVSIKDLEPLTLAYPIQGTALGQGYYFVQGRWLPANCVTGVSVAKPPPKPEKPQRWGDCRLLSERNLIDNLTRRPK